jgi:hypothetical protein
MAFTMLDFFLTFNSRTTPPDQNGVDEVRIVDFIGVFLPEPPHFRDGDDYVAGQDDDDDDELVEDPVAPPASTAAPPFDDRNEWRRSDASLSARESLLVPTQPVVFVGRQDSRACPGSTTSARQSAMVWEFLFIRDFRPTAV